MKFLPKFSDKTSKWTVYLIIRQVSSLKGSEKRERDEEETAIEKEQ